MSDRVQPYSPSPSPTSSPHGEGSPRLREQIAFGDNAPVLIRHDQNPALPQLIERRDRAISRAARLTALIKVLNVPLEGVSFPVEMARVEHCARLQAKRDRWIDEAVALTVEIDGSNENAAESVRRAVSQKARKLNASNEFRKVAFDLGPKSRPLDPVRGKAYAGQVPASEGIGKCAVLDDVAEKNPEVAEQPVDPKIDPWSGLLDVAPGKDTEARLDDLVAAGRRPGPGLAQQAIDRKRHDLIELLVKRDLIDPSTVVDDGGLKTLLFYGLCHELNDSYLITLVNKNANLETKAAPVRIQRGGPAPDSSAFHVVTDILTLAIRRKWTERDLVALIDWKVRKGDISCNNKVDESKILALLYSWKYFEAVKFLVAYSLPTKFLVEGRTFLGKVLFDGGPLAREFVLGTSVSGARVLPFDWHTKFDLHAKGDNGQTALHDLLEGAYDEDIFMRMMNLGANPYEKNNDGKSAIELLFERIQEKSGKAVPRNEKRNFERFVEKHYKPVKK